jgi:uncharacterized Rossmann fold enzyme
LQKLAEIEELKMKNLDWAQCLIAYKETKDEKGFRDVMMSEHMFG